MAKRPSVKEILELARKGGAAQPSGGSAEEVPAEESAPEPAAAMEAAPAPAADVPTPSSLGRPLTLKEKLAAARAGGAGAPPAAAKPAAAAPPVTEEAGAEAPAEAPRAVPAPAAPLGRPMTLKEKLAAARSGGGGAAPAAGAKPAAGAAKPAAKPAAAAGAKAAPRALPPLEKITDPKDLAEAARQTAAKKEKEVAAKLAEATPPKAKAASKEVKPSTVLPKPGRATPGATAAATTAPVSRRRQFFKAAAEVCLSWLFIAWATFAAGCAIFTAMMGRFMFPNVLAEPPSTIKIGLPSNFDPEDVNERFKAEWGFWVVRSTRYNGQDIIYALQSVCTHLGCPPNWLAGEQKFKCPCHGSGFYISGINFEGPAPRPLERFKVTVADDGQIIVDKSQKFQQELGQWSDTDSYIQA